MDLGLFLLLFPPVVRSQVLLMESGGGIQKPGDSPPLLQSLRVHLQQLPYELGPSGAREGPGVGLTDIQLC
uniref:Uncharacterized protein n=1 Tax=Chelonoidis abingdonii TaxID=106734 RepID=A0A8C0HF56_CHEAB